MEKTLNTKTTTLTVAELTQLHTELTGAEKQTGLLQERLPMVLKYHLTKLAKIAFEEHETTEKLRSEIITKLGTKNEETGEVSIPKVISGENDTLVANPSFIEYIQEFTAILNVVKEIEHHNFLLSEFETIETSAVYPVFMSLISEE
jgi:hypothetical protein